MSGASARPRLDPSTAFAKKLGECSSPEAPARLLGLEHEFRLFAHGQSLDFRTIIHGLGITGRRLDPGDTNAYRCPSGIALTCDDAEAEIASPPVPTRRGFAGSLEAWALAGQAELTRVLPKGTTMQGFSTHLSASMPADLNEAACQLYAQTFAPALMLLMDSASSAGIDVRPRPGRLEVCGEYIDGPRLRTVASFVAGSVMVCAAAVARSAGRAPADAGLALLLPPLLSISIVGARERYGFRIWRTAFGLDLCRQGRQAHLSRASGGTITAQEQLEIAWLAARAAIGHAVGARDLETMDHIVSGRLPLAIEGSLPADRPTSVKRRSSAVYGGVLQARERPTFQVRPGVVTWSFTIFEIDGHERPAYACVPRPALARYLQSLDSGRLDRVIQEYLWGPREGRQLKSNVQTLRPALWDALGDVVALLPAESAAPQGSPLGQLGETSAVAVSSTQAATRPGKPSRVPLVPGYAFPDRTAWGANWGPLLFGGGLLLLLLIGLAAFLLLNGGNRTETSSPGSQVELTPDTQAQPVPIEPSTVPVTAQEPPKPPPPPTPAGPILSGTYTGSVPVSDDPAGHRQFVGMPGQLTLAVSVSRNTQTGVVTIRLTGDPPWVNLTGTAQFGPAFGATGGDFTATGAGTVAGFSDVAVSFTGSVTAQGGLKGTLTVGTNGALPTGRPISYAPSLTKPQ